MVTSELPGREIYFSEHLLPLQFLERLLYCRNHIVRGGGGRGYPAFFALEQIIRQDEIPRALIPLRRTRCNRPILIISREWKHVLMRTVPSLPKFMFSFLST